MQNTVDVRSQICSKGVSIFNRYACWLVVSDQNQGDMLGERGQDFGYHDGMDCSQLYSACLFRMHIYIYFRSGIGDAWKRNGQETLRSQTIFVRSGIIINYIE